MPGRQAKKDNSYCSAAGEKNPFEPLRSGASHGVGGVDKRGWTVCPTGAEGAEECHGWHCSISFNPETFALQTGSGVMK